MGRPNNGSDSSSGEEDGDADRRAAIASIVATSSFTTSSSSFTNGGFTNTSISNHSIDEQKNKPNPQKLKHYQIKAQKILDDILEKSLEIMRDPIHVVSNDPKIDEGGIRLFRGAPLGIVFDHVDEVQRPKKRPKILPGEEINEKSEKFKWQIQSVTVDGMDIMAAAKDACQRSLARLEAKDARAKAAAKKEEERVAELKKIRGERWLPSIAREKQVKPPNCNPRLKI